MRSVFVACSLVLLVGALGCTSVEDGAKDEFAEKYTCPRDRVEARARKELKATDVEGSEAKAAPPSEVAADPGRLEMWRKEQQEKDERTNDYHHVVEARGCGHQVLYTCGHTTGKSSTPWLCMEYAYPKGVSKW